MSLKETKNYTSLFLQHRNMSRYPSSDVVDLVECIDYCGYGTNPQWAFTIQLGDASISTAVLTVGYNFCADVSSVKSTTFTLQSEANGGPSSRTFCGAPAQKIQFEVYDALKNDVTANYRLAHSDRFNCFASSGFVSPLSCQTISIVPRAPVVAVSMTPHPITMAATQTFFSAYKSRR